MGDPIPTLSLGVRYRIRYQSKTQRRVREAVMIYLGGEAWSARPVAGTQLIPEHWIKSVEEVDYNTQPYLNRMVK